MTLTLLLDLDDTLLNTNLPAFFPAYLQALSKELAPQIPPEKVLRALLSCTNQMMVSEDFSRTLEQVFFDSFYPMLGLEHGALTDSIKKFYDQIFPTLAGLTSKKAESKPFVEWALSDGHRVAVATDPILPREATHQRIQWAGFEPEQFEIVSTFEHFHFTKTYPAYYAEVLGRMGWPEGPVLMVGNDLERDIRPAKLLGLVTYFVDVETASKSGPEAGAHGSLQDLPSWLESTDLTKLVPSFRTKESVIAVLLSTPAVLRGLTRKLDAQSWVHEPAPNDWAMTELVCHLRDTDREIHKMQVNLFKEQAEPFIPRPDTSIWASQRDYLHENGVSALAEFVSERQKLIELIRSIPESEWERKARHAIFGPTNFLEVISFMADHDRLHIQQAWRLLKQDK
jgi:FMN phosphatase YigB (HAD superfamily)